MLKIYSNSRQNRNRWYRKNGLWFADHPHHVATSILVPQLSRRARYICGDGWVRLASILWLLEWYL